MSYLIPIRYLPEVKLRADIEGLRYYIIDTHQDTMVYIAVYFSLTMVYVSLYLIVLGVI